MGNGLWKKQEWTVKVDPDAVFLPDRLHDQLKRAHGSDSVYLNNCDQGLHGPIEIVSHAGMADFEAGIDKCVTELKHEWGWQGEDVFLRHCLGILKVSRVD